MRVVVCGSRTWSDDNAVYGRLAQLPKDAIIIHGHHWEGTDAAVHRWCRDFARDREWPVPAAWKGLGRGAGPRRNEIMAALAPDLVIAFRAEGKSNGTDHMIAVAMRDDIPIEVIRA